MAWKGGERNWTSLDGLDGIPSHGFLLSEPVRASWELTSRPLALLRPEPSQYSSTQVNEPVNAMKRLDVEAKIAHLSKNLNAFPKQRSSLGMPMPSAMLSTD